MQSCKFIKCMKRLRTAHSSPLKFVCAVAVSHSKFFCKVAKSSVYTDVTVRISLPVHAVANSRLKMQPMDHCIQG